VSETSGDTHGEKKALVILAAVGASACKDAVGAAACRDEETGDGVTIGTATDEVSVVKIYVLNNENHRTKVPVHVLYILHKTLHSRLLGLRRLRCFMERVAGEERRALQRGGLWGTQGEEAVIGLEEVSE
jgi:hypothetical protein